jgi:hypothetical protein
MAGGIGGIYVPTDDELDYDFITALLYVDYAEDVARVSEWVTSWYDAATGYFAPLRSAVPPTHGFQRVSAKVRPPGGAIRSHRPRTFLAGLTDDLYLLSVEWSVGDEALWSSLDHGTAYTNVRLTAHRFGPERNHLGLRLVARVARHVRNPQQLATEVVDLIAQIANGARPSYGEVSLTVEQRPPATRLDSVLNRDPVESAECGRTWLRGYEWATICPAELADRLGGAGRLRSSTAFVKVVELADGAALLLATAEPQAYDDAAAALVRECLRPVLPPETGVIAPDPGR